MGEKVVGLTTRDQTEAGLVRQDVERLYAHVRDHEVVAIASVLIYADGTTSVQTRGYKCRALLLGAVTDLQFSLAKDGDAH